MGKKPKIVSKADAILESLFEDIATQKLNVNVANLIPKDEEKKKKKDKKREKDKDKKRKHGHDRRRSRSRSRSIEKGRTPPWSRSPSPYDSRTPMKRHHDKASNGYYSEDYDDYYEERRYEEEKYQTHVYRSPSRTPPKRSRKEKFIIEHQYRTPSPEPKKKSKDKKKKDKKKEKRHKEHKEQKASNDFAKPPEVQKVQKPSIPASQIVVNHEEFGPNVHSDMSVQLTTEDGIPTSSQDIEGNEDNSVPVESLNLEKEIIIKAPLRLKKGDVLGTKESKIDFSEIDITIYRKHDPSEIKKTKTEMAFAERQRQNEFERLKKKAQMSHREKIEKFNKDLDELTEFNEIPRINWVK